MLKSLIGGILAAIVIIVGIGLCLPSSYMLQAETTINKAVEEVFPQVNNLKKWQNWAYQDSNAVANLQYSGPVEGVGAMYTWKDEQSAGRMEVLEEIPNQQIKLKLTTDYGVRESELTFDFSKIDEQKTLVRWTQVGDVGYDVRARFFIALGGLKNSIGNNNQEALERLKKIVVL